MALGVRWSADKHPDWSWISMRLVRFRQGELPMCREPHAIYSPAVVENLPPPHPLNGYQESMRFG